jgi:hypothetical protein
MKRKITLFFLITTIMLAGISNTGCAKTNYTGYKQTTANIRGVFISFKYPDSYKDQSGTLTKPLEEPFGILLGIPYNSQYGYPLENPILEIGSYKSYSNAKSELDDLLNGYKNLINLKDRYQLIERYTTIVGGIKSESAAYWIIYVNDPSEKPTFVRVVYLDHKKLIWTIKVSSYQDMEEQAKTEFDHIIKSFKFLN